MLKLMIEPARMMRPVPSGNTSPFLPCAYSFREVALVVVFRLQQPGHGVVDDREALGRRLGLDRLDPAVLGQARIGVEVAPPVGRLGRHDERLGQRHDPVRLADVPLVAVRELDGGGMSAGLPRNAPPSTHAASVAISASLSDRSYLNPCTPTFLSMYQGGISRTWTFSLMARAQGRVSS